LEFPPLLYLKVVHKLPKVDLKFKKLRNFVRVAINQVRGKFPPMRFGQKTLRRQIMSSKNKELCQEKLAFCQLK